MVIAGMKNRKIQSIDEKEGTVIVEM